MLTADIMELIEEYAQIRHTNGSHLYNIATSKARLSLLEYIHAASLRPAGEVVVTSTESGRCVAVTRQDSEGRILSVIWEAPPDTARELTEAQIEQLAVTFEDFGFGAVDAHGCTTHGFGPKGLVAFARAVASAPIQTTILKDEVSRVF